MLVRFLRCAGLALGLAASCSGKASAAALSFLSVAGANAGDCSDPKAPCRTLSYALTKTSTGGEIKTLLPGNYGTATITTAITLTGVPSSLIMVGSGAVGLTINALSSQIVSISGFTLNGQGIGKIGVVVTKAGQLILRDCAIKNFTQTGVQLRPVTAMKFSIEDAFIANVGTYGVEVNKTGCGSATGVVHRSTIIGRGTSGIGVFLTQSANVRVSDSLIGHFEFGIYSGASPGNVLRVTRNTVSQNVNGVVIEKDVGSGRRDGT